MPTIVKSFGWVQIVFGVAIAFFGAMRAGDNVVGALWLVGTGFSLIVSGALFWCFGAIVDHLAAIRAGIDRVNAAQGGSVSAEELARWKR